MKQNIPLIDVKAQNEPLKQEILRAMEKVIDASAFILGGEVKSFEEEFQAYTGVNFSVACASGSDALMLPLMCAGIGPGDEVLVPSFTFYATAGAVARLGAKPVFVDSDETYNICLKDMERKIGARTKAVIPVHLFGQMVDMEALDRALAPHNDGQILVIEDCAQSIGAEFKGKQAGAWGDFGAFSFYPTKNLGAMGDAGLVSAKDAEGADLLKMVRVHGSKQRYYHERIGVNSRLDSLQAAVLRIKLRHLPQYEEKRSALADEYFRSFSAIALDDHLTMPVVGKNRKHVWNQFTIRAKKRDQLRAFLTERTVGSEVYYPLSMHRQEAFQFDAIAPKLPVCEALEQEVLSLPMYPEMPLENVHRVVEQIGKFYGK